MTLTPGSPPRSVPDLIAALSGRIRKLETTRSLRVGGWTLVDVDGTLTAMRPGTAPVPVLVTATDTADMTAEVRQQMRALMAAGASDVATEGGDPLTIDQLVAAVLGRNAFSTLLAELLVPASAVPLADTFAQFFEMLTAGAGAVSGGLGSPDFAPFLAWLGITQTQPAFTDPQRIGDQFSQAILDAFLSGIGPGTSSGAYPADATAAVNSWWSDTVTTSTNVVQTWARFWAAVFNGGVVPAAPVHIADFTEAASASTERVSGLSSQVQRIAAGQAGTQGKSFFVDFAQRADADSLGTDFHQTYYHAGASVVGIRSGKAVYVARESNATRRSQNLYLPVQFGLDFQRVSVVVATKGNLFYIIGRSNAAGTRYVRANHNGSVVSIAYINANGQTTSLSGVSHTLIPAVYHFDCGTEKGARTFRVLQNDTVILEAIEQGTESLVGPDYRYGGFDLGNGSPQIAAFAGYDNAPAPVLGSGATMSRRATAGAYVATNTTAPLSNLFDTTETVTDDIVSNPAQSSFAVSVTDWYTLTAVAHSPTGLFPTSLEFVLYVGSAIRSYGGDVGRFQTPVGGSPIPRHVTATFVEYLLAGDTVRLGASANGNSGGDCFRGEPSGAATRFTITRGKGQQVATS